MTSYQYSKIIGLLEQYKGQIKADGSSLTIENVNTLEWMGEKKKVNCHVRIYECEGEYPFIVDAEEQTISIIGGCGCPCESLEETLSQVERLLGRYKFEKKVNQQTSLF